MRLKIITSIIAFLFMSIEIAHGHDLFCSQWVSLGIGGTGKTFKGNEENNKGIGAIYSISISSTIIQQFFLTISSSKVKEFQFPLLDVHEPIEYLNQKTLLIGRYFVIRDICILPAMGYSWLDGINRGKWVGEPGVESYLYESLHYKSDGIPWALQLNTNANGSLGLGLLFSGTMNSKKNYWGISLLLKIGKQQRLQALKTNW